MKILISTGWQAERKTSKSHLGAASSEFRVPSFPHAFTLIELMVTIAIVGILASMVLFAMFGAQETARENKTKSLITKLNNIVMPKYESYRTRRVPISVTSATLTGAQGLQLAAKYRLDALHDLMRMELPDRWTDVTDAPVTLLHPDQPASGTNPYITRPAINQAYLAAYNSAATPPSGTYQNAECLYLIATLGATDSLGGRELFNAGNIDDVDKDGFKEFIDGWGQPIRFLRWAPGFPSEMGRQAVGVVVSASSGGSSTTIVATGFTQPTGTYNTLALLVASGTAAPGVSGTITGCSLSGSQTTFTISPAMLSVPIAGDRIAVMDPDPFDPRYVYGGGLPATFAIYPLIYSAGSNKTSGILTDPTGSLDYAAVNNNPFFGGPSTGQMVGAQVDLSGEQTTVSGWESNGWLDNVHNHLMLTR